MRPWESGQDHVAIMMRNRPEWLESMLGAFAARAVPANVNFRYTAKEVAQLLTIIRPMTMVVEAGFAPLMREAIERSGVPVSCLLQVPDESGGPLVSGAAGYEEALDAASPLLNDLHWSADDKYMLLTGGTTGLPKAVLWRQADIAVAALNMWDTKRRALVTLQEVVSRIPANSRPSVAAPPFMHGGAQWNALSVLFTGNTVVIQDVVSHLDPVDIWQTVERSQATMLLIAGNAFARPLLDALAVRTFDLSSLTFILTGAVALSAGTKRELIAALPHVTIVETAGASESGTQLAMRSRTHDELATGVFEPSLGTAILDADRSRKLDQDDDAVGWLARSGPIPQGYLNDPKGTLSTFPVIGGVRYCVPGDRAYYRADGTIQLIGRDSQTINSGGEKVFAEEVEQVIIEHPGVADVVVLGCPSERWGQEVAALIQPRDGVTLTASEVVTWASAHLARYKLPRRVLVVPSVTRNAAGKIDYASARRVVAASQGQDDRTAGAVDW
jgi:fatty-acyl-CoA synthase